MTGLIGTSALVVGVVAAAVGCAGWITAARGGAPRIARWATYGLLAAAAVASGALQWALVTHDFSVRYVAEQGGRDVPLYYTVTSMWGALEGSLVLWLLVLGVVAVLAMWRRPAAEELHAPAMAVVSGVALFFFALALGGGNAFDTVSPVPADGPGPNPLLRDHPAMGIHPPLLYAGYVALTVPFAYAVAALARGTAGPGWVRAVRGWTLGAWACLTAGIVLGAWWSYAVLGWGGYWAWDPVENAALLPWLTTTALLHSLVVQLRRGTLPVWNLSLAIASFALVLTGTFLTRSGVVDSVHAFTRSAVGPMLLGFLALVLASSLGLLAWRTWGGSGGEGPRDGAVLSRQTALLGNNLVLTVIAFTVLLGTVFPLLHVSVTGEDVSVGPPYYSRMVTPAAFVLLVLMAVGPLVAWDRDEPARLAGRVAAPAAVAAAVVGALGLVGVGPAVVLLAVGLAVFVVGTLVRQVVQDARPVLRRQGRTPWRRLLAAGPRRRVGVLAAHAGVVLAAVAVTTSSAYGATRSATLEPGEELRVDGTGVVLEDVRRWSDDRRMAATATVTAGRSADSAARLQPTLTFYREHGMVVATPAIDGGIARDVYVTLLEVDEDAGTATVRLAVNPMIGLLWVAGGVVLLGAALAAPWPRRATRRAPASGAPLPAEVAGWGS